MNNEYKTKRKQEQDEESRKGRSITLSSGPEHSHVVIATIYWITALIRTRGYCIKLFAHPFNVAPERLKSGLEEVIANTSGILLDFGLSVGAPLGAWAVSISCRISWQRKMAPKPQF